MDKERGLIGRMLGRIVWAGDVERYHTMKTIRTDTVHHHTAIVAHILHAVMPEDTVPAARYRMLLAALRHDLGEGAEIPCGPAAGDIPAPTKRITPEVKILFDQMEDERCAAAGLEIPPLSTEQARMLKFADNMSGMIFCVQELTLGHSGIRTVYYTFRDYVAADNPKGIERTLFDIVQDWWEEAARGVLWHRGTESYERK
jgi:5'-deoxynucleotidase YfbR-like HD superfamily hydrolase